MLRWSTVLVTAILVGCTAPEAPPDLPEPVAPAPEAPIIAVPEVHDAEIIGEDCQIGGAVELIDPTTARTLLPAGFSPRDAASLIDLAAASGQAALLHGWALCGGGQYLGSSSIFIEHPDVPFNDTNREFFALHTWTNWPQIMAWLDLHGLPYTGDAEVAIEILVHETVPNPASPTPDPGPTAGGVSVTGNATTALTFDLSGTTGYRFENETFRFFHADETLHRIDILPTQHGTGGAGRCSYASDSIYAQWSGAACGEKGVLGMMAPAQRILVVMGET